VNTRRQQSTWGVPVFILLLLLGIAASAPSKTAKPCEEMLVLPGKVGVRGGRVVAALRSEPKTLNPLTALNLPSKEVIHACDAWSAVHCPIGRETWSDRRRSVDRGKQIPAFPPKSSVASQKRKGSCDYYLCSNAVIFRHREILDGICDRHFGTSPGFMRIGCVFESARC
jgi:hypothetical protein